jgi:2-methylisocitrate lyase-like PEP mutase family enzyme
MTSEIPGQREPAATFSALHVTGRPVVLFNVWDAGSATTVARAGARALATGAQSTARLAALGAARISYGPGPYRLARHAIEEAARRVISEAE